MSGSDWTGGVPPYGGADTGTPTTTAYAGLGKRFLARIIDGLVVAVPLSVLIAILPGVRLGGFASGIVSTLVGVAYFVLMETSRGATLGKMALGLSVGDESGRSPISTEASFRRNGWMLLGLLNGIPLIGWLAGLVSLGVVIAIAVTIANDDRHRGVHDQFAHTVVVERV